MQIYENSISNPGFPFEHPLMMMGRPEHPRQEGFMYLASRLGDTFEGHPVMTGSALPLWLKKGKASPKELEHLLLQTVIFFNHLYLAERKGRASREPEMFKDLQQLVLVPDSHSLAPIRRFFQFLHSYVMMLKIPFGPLLRQAATHEATYFLSQELLGKLHKGPPSCRLAARFALESWISSGFWDHFATKLMMVKSEMDLRMMPLELFGSRSSDLPASSPLVAEIYFQCGINEERFVADVHETLDCLQDFWSTLHFKHCYAQK